MGCGIRIWARFKVYLVLPVTDQLVSTIWGGGKGQLAYMNRRILPFGGQTFFGNAEFGSKDKILHAFGYREGKILLICGRSLVVLCIKSPLNVYIGCTGVFFVESRVWHANYVRSWFTKWLSWYIDTANAFTRVLDHSKNQDRKHSGSNQALTSHIERAPREKVKQMIAKNVMRCIILLLFEQIIFFKVDAIYREIVASLYNLVRSNLSQSQLVRTMAGNSRLQGIRECFESFAHSMKAADCSVTLSTLLLGGTS